METDEKDGAAKEAEEGEPAKAARAPEALLHRLDNPCRVTPAQQKFVALEEGSRWQPIHPARPLTGIVVFKDMEPGAHSSRCQRAGLAAAFPLGLQCGCIMHVSIPRCLYLARKPARYRRCGVVQCCGPIMHASIPWRR